jgi:hypothetical protein
MGRYTTEPETTAHLPVVFRKNAAQSILPVLGFSGGNLRETIFMMQLVKDGRSNHLVITQGKRGRSQCR